MRRFAWLVLIALVPGTGCQRDAGEPERAASGAAGSTPGSTAASGETPQPLLRWECDGGFTLTTRYLPRDRAVSLGLHEGERKLPQVPSASGEKYQEGPITFARKGRTAIYERTPAPPVDCRLTGG